MSGFSRVSIPDSLQRTIQDIREKAGEHSDEDIYAALKDCNMDPDETAQRILYIDTFEEVKSKRDRRKVSVNNRAFGEQRQVPGNGKQWPRGTSSRGDNRYSSYNSDGGRRPNARQENGYRGTIGRASKSSMPVVQKESNKKPVVASSSHESTDQRSASGAIRDGKANGDTKSRKLSSLRLKQHPDVSHPGPTPTPTPTNPSAATRNRIPAGGILSSRLGNSNGPLPVSGMYSSASDPVLVPSLDPRHPGSAGIIKREARRHSRHDNRQSEPMKPQGSDESHLAKPQQSNEMLLSKEAGVESDRCSKQATSEIDVKLRTSVRRPSVIFPNHLHVPEALKSALTFGSVDYFLERNNEGSNPRDASVPTNIVSSPTPQISSAPMSGPADHPESPPHVPVNLTPSQENSNNNNNSSSSDLLRYDQSKLQPPVGRSHDSGSGLVPPPAAAAQSSIAMSPQLFPFYRQHPYPPNYVPYSPYYSQLYMPPPQNVSHHSGFPHQASPAGNIYKYPVPPVYKPGSMTHFGISSGYGTYGGSSPGPGSGAALPTFGLHDISGSDLKENNIIHSNIKQKEDLHVLTTSTSARDTSALPANVYYNLPQ